MKDDADKKLDELFATFRSESPDTSRLEYGFETRLLARLRGERQPEMEPWFALAWRFCPIFAGIVVALCIWTYFSPPDIDLQTLVKSGGDETQLTEFFTGNQI